SPVGQAFQPDVFAFPMGQAGRRRHGKSQAGKPDLRRENLAMSFWCSVCLYVPVERLGAALRATAAFAVIQRKGKVKVALPDGETLSLPRMYYKKRTPAALACRGGLTSFADCATFWFPVDDVIHDEEEDYFEEEGLELPIEVRDSVECFPVANVT